MKNDYIKPDVSIIIPAFNESSGVEPLFSALREFVPKSGFSMQFVFVDDGSSDDTYERLAHQRIEGAQIRVIKLSRNFGSHAALRAGIFHAAADCCVFYYMDMPEDPSCISRYYEALQNGAELAYGERVGYRASLGSRIFAKLLDRFSDCDYPKDGVVGLGFGKKIKAQLNANIETDSSIFLQLFQLGFKKQAIPAQLQPRKSGKSKWTFSKKVKLFVDTFVMFSYMPIRLISIIGILFALFGVLLALFLVVVKVFQLFPLAAGWPMLISLIAIGFGITNVSLGIIAEYLLRTLATARKRPVFIADEIHDSGAPIERHGEDTED